MGSTSYLSLFVLAVLSLVLVACTPISPVANNSTTTALNSTSPWLPATGNNTLGPAMQPSTPSSTTANPSNSDFGARLTYTEGDLITLKTKANSPDNVPVTLEFSAPFSKSGVWQTKIGDAGDYPVTVTARDSRGLSSTERILVTIKYANRAPVITGPDQLTVKEGDTIHLQYTATDPDVGDQVVLSYSGWMKSDSYTTTYTDAGTYNVTVTASDGKLTTKKIVPVTVIDVNRAPVITFGASSMTGKELDRIDIPASAIDPDGGAVSLSFSKPFDAQGRWTPKYDDAGNYTVTVTATDSGGATSTGTILVKVLRANRPPTITVPGGSLSYKETDLIDLRSAVSVIDPEADEVVVKYSGWMNSSTYQTSYDDAGKHTVTISATDSHGLTTTKDVQIVVEDVNRPPVFVRIA